VYRAEAQNLGRLLAHRQNIVAEGFLNPQQRRALIVEADAEALLARLAG
jgi:hypothetical protein